MRFVHLSDLHFNPDKDGRTSREMRERLIPYLQGLNLSADELLITGDFRYAKDQGKEQKDIDAVVAFIKEIAEAVNISSVKHVHLVPGNHDRDRISDEEDDEEDKKRIEKIREQYDSDNGRFEEDDLAFLLQPFDYFRMVCDTLYGADNYWEAGKLHTYRVLGGTVFLYLNTAIMHNTDDDRGRLIIGNDCLDRLLREIKTKYPDFPIIVLAHHSPDCFKKQEKEAVEHILMNHPNASLYLCGDAHEAWPRKVNYHLEITMGCLTQDKGVETTFLTGDTDLQELTAHHWVKAWEPYTAMNEKFQKLLPPKRIAKKLPFNNIPYSENIHFTGRIEILEEMKNHLNPGEKKPHSLALYGLGAVGKTEIALEYTLKNGHLYDVIWWVSAENEAGIINSYNDFLLKKEIIKEDATCNSEEIVQFIKGWMERNNNWLFIYDNAESEKEVTPYLPRVNTGHILITTQNPNWRNSKRIAVDVFKPPEAVDFFNRFELDGNPDEAEVLAEELGYLPLALEQAAAYMLENDKTYQEYLGLFQQYRLEVFEKAEYDSPYGKTVATTWHMALKKIEDEGAIQLLRLLAFLAPDHIPKDMFCKAKEHLPEPLSSAVTNELDFNNTIRTLTKYSLIQSDKGVLRIHRLLQEVIRQSLGEEKDRYFQYCVKILNKLFRYNPYVMTTWDNCTRFMPHVQVFLTYTEELNKETEEIANLFSQGAGWLNHLALYEEAQKWLKKALAIKEKVLGLEHPDTAATYHNIATVYDSQGDYSAALKWYKKALAITEKVLGLEHPDTAITYNNIALVYDNQGEYQEALRWYKKALVIYEKVLGLEHPLTATTYNNIASVYDSQGDYPAALIWYQKALAIKEKVLGLEHPDTAATYNNIATVYNRQGNYQEALKWHKKALAITEKVLGLEHPLTATTYHNIALVYYRQGDYQEAQKWHKKALVIAEKVLGLEHPDTAATYNNIALVYKHQGDYQEALKWYEKALAIFEKVLGLEHPSTATTYNNIASVYDSLGDYQEALKWYEKALTIAEKVLGYDHPNTKTMRENMGLVKKKMNSR